MSVIILICSAVIELATVWWFITLKYRKPVSLKRFVSWLVLMVCAFLSPLFQIFMIRQIVAQKELANTLAYGWVIFVGMCVLTLMFRLLLKAQNKDNQSSVVVPKERR